MKLNKCDTCIHERVCAIRMIQPDGTGIYFAGVLVATMAPINSLEDVPLEECNIYKADETVLPLIQEISP